MERIEEAMHANVLRALLRVGSLTPRAAVRQTDTWLLIDAGVGMQDFNFALPKTVPGDPDAALDEAAEWYRARGQPFRLELRAKADSALVNAAVYRGLACTDSEPTMLLAALPAPEGPAGELVVYEALSEADIVRYAEVDARRWHEITRGIAATAARFPDFHLMLGEVAGEAIGTAMAVVTGEMVGVYNVHVQPEHRRQGFGRALTLAAIEAGRREGVTAACLQATPMGERLYTGLGFRKVDDYLSFLSG